MIEEIVESTPKSLAGDEAPVSTKVAEEVTESLKAAGYRALLAVVCHYHEGVLVLQGRVPSFYLKQVAQVQASKVPDVEVIVNRVTVDDAIGGR